MKLYCLHTLLTCCCLLWTVSLLAKADSVRIQTVLPYINAKGQLVADVFFRSDPDQRFNLSIRCFKILSAADSMLVFSRNNIMVRPAKDVQVLHNIISTQDDSARLNRDLYDIMRQTGSLPAGDYKIDLDLKSGEELRQYYFSYKVDSSLSKRSPVSEDFRELFAPGKQTGLKGMFLSTVKNTAGNNLSVLNKAQRKIGRVFKKKGLTQSPRAYNGSVYFDVYYKDWFVGYYRLDTTNSIIGSVNAERASIAGNGSALVNNELEDIQSLFTQFKELDKKKKKEQEVSGEIGLSTYLGTGQEENSATENNYYELRGHMEMPVMQIPISIEGFYTSQDRNRTVKASYIKLHYDTEKAKEQLLSLISGYNEKYDNTVAKGKGLESVYSTYLQKLETEKGKMLAEARKQYGAELAGGSVDTAALRKQISETLMAKTKDSGSLDTTSISAKADRARTMADSANRLYERALQQYEKAEKLQQSIDKYQRLIAQYKNTTYFDSVLAHDKVKDLNNAQDLSYKELAKKASGLLPEGKAKSFISGLTHVDAGMFNKEVSSYTLSGQNVKGLDLGYDLGFCQTAFTVGRIEYVGRDGSLDKYTGYSARVMFKPGSRQKASVIYYGYTPSKKMLTEDKFFSNVDLAMPSFRSPVHIVSVTYSGDVQKSIRYEAEAATSFRKQATAESANTTMTDRMAYNVKLEGDVPNTNITAEAGYEHAGKDFENNTAPVNLSGLERYHAGVQGAFLKNFLSLGVEFNYLEQQSFSGKGGNTKWGFDIKTKSKRYPSVGLSYKPFATFRSFNDTLGIPQRPLVGEVWTGRVSWQLKRRDYSLRLTSIYNNNTSTMDTISTHVNVFQLNAIYQKKIFSLMLNVARTSSAGTDTAALHQGVTLVTLAGSRTLSTQATVSGGVDAGAASFGMSRFAFNIGGGYRFRKASLTIRAGCRYNAYRLGPEYGWRQLINGTIDLLWQFKFKLSE